MVVASTMASDERSLADDDATPVLTTRASRGSAAGFASLLRGDLVGRYVILERVGEGGMGVVYAAYDPELDRRVAIKLVRPDLRDADSRARMLREAKAMARLRHPAVIAIHDIGEIDDQVFLAMEFIDGVTLGAWLREFPRRWQEVLGVFLQAGRGLAAAHQAAVLHRDFKPDNVLVARDGRAIVTDFGLARPTAPTPAELETLRSAPDVGWQTHDLTDARQLLGTPSYMAPEQLAGGPADERSEQFAFCVALFEGLHGVRPFAGGSVEVLRAAIAAGQLVPRPPERAVPAWLDRAVTRGLDGAPSRRWPSMQALLAALERGPPHRRWPWLAAGLLALAGVFAAARPATNEAERCSGSELRVRDVWDDARRHALRRALLSAGTGDRSPTAAAVEREVDRYTQAWAGARRDACVATHARGEQSDAQLERRMDCFDRQLRELDGLLTTLEQVAGDTLDHAAGAVRRLPPPGRCAVGELRLEASSAGDDPLARRLAELETLARLKQSARVLPLAQALIRDASEDPDPSLVLAARYLLGGAQLDMGDLPGAQLTLEETYWEAVRAGLDELAARAALDRTSVTAQGPELEATRTWARHAEAAVMRAGGDPQLLGKLAGILALGEQARGDLAAARAHHERALELLARAGPGARGDLGSAHANFASALRRAGDEQAAREHHERALALFEEHWGSDHPNTHSVRLNLATLLAAHGEEARARTLLDEARVGLERALGADHPSLGVVWGTLGGLEYAHGRHGAARAAFARAYRLALATYGSADERTLTPLFNLGNTAHASGDLGEARQFFERVLAARIALRGPEHPELVRCWTALASVAIDQRRFDAAGEALDRALAIQQSALGRQHIDTAWILVRQAELAEVTGALDRAREHYLEAVAIARATTDAARPDTGLILHSLARLERRMRRDADARGDAEAALAILSRFHADTEPRLAELRRLLAELPPSSEAAGSSAPP
ncbi:serine/threonine-protein kinase [Nannocystis bainbridge]|uniref:Serine/threonine-protein kinase n=1 Tax=Nannocystis bainbridge TaxID=2995303 RepID=A0ABT5ECZ0_9BACT|nr:serine/threonine-protein kinase [Nannocystis bainbridge]MDC0723746.1 serine/threonine-protein kinase [Nannocystis bainbridge]